MSSLRDLLRPFVPLSLRQTVAQARRRWRDRMGKVRWSDTRGSADLSGYMLHVELVQAVLPGSLLENKLANLALGAQRIHLSVLAPNQTWSFWRLVQQPSKRKGFLAGRNLVNGKLVPQIGGGLCQLSSLIYHLGLLSGLVIAERHPHSVDIYREGERYTPLGADATVVWGFKDLRLANPHGADVMFECLLRDGQLIGRVHARAALPQYAVEFLRQPVAGSRVTVNTVVNTKPHTTTCYEQRPGLAL